MAKSKARFLAELLSSDGKVIKTKSQASTIVVGDLPTIPNSKLQNSSVTIAGEGLSLGASLTLDTGDVTEHTNYKYYTDGRVDARITNAGSGNWNTAYGWGNHASASYITNSTASLSAAKITSGVLSSARIPVPTNGDWWNDGFVKVQTDGVMEVGRYLDFHTADSGGATDFDLRVTASAGALAVGGTISATGGNSGNWNTAYGWGNHASAGYTNDQTDAEIRAAVEAASDSNVFTDADHTKLGGIAASANNYVLPSGIATETYVGNQITTLIGGAPSTLNDLNELAAAINDDANYNTTLTTALATKLPLAGGTLTGALIAPSLQLGADSQPTLSGDGNTLRIQTTGGYFDIGANNSGFAHLQTDRSNFYFNKRITVDTGEVSSYDENLTLMRVGSTTARLRITAGTTISDQPLSVTGIVTATGGNSGNWNTAYGWGNHASAGYTNDQTAAEILTAIKTVDGSGSGLDADLLDGVQGASYLRSDAADTFTGTLTMGTQQALVANNYGRGVYGVYSSTKHQHVWSMGTSYNLADDGSGVGSLYGLSYTHTNIGTGYGSSSAAGLGHQLNGRANGTLQWALGEGMWSAVTGSVWGASNDGAGSGLDADLLDGQQGSYYAPSSSIISKGGNTGLTAGFKMTFHSGAGGATFGANHYSMGIDVANGSWSGPNYSDLIIGFHTGIRIGAAYGGTKFYNNSPTTDTNNNGEGDGSEALLMTVGGVNGGSGVKIENALIIDGAGNLQTIDTTTNSLEIKNSSATSSGGLVLQGSDGTHGLQLYWDGSGANYGFLDGAWAGWDIKKVVNGNFSVDEGSGLFRVWNIGNDGSGSGLDADYLDGVEGASFARLGGTDHLRSIPNRWFATADADNNIDHYTHAYAKAAMGLTYKYNNSRTAITSDTSYWVGTMGYGTIDMNTMFTYGSGDIDSWGNPANQPSGTTHWVGSQHLHYTTGSGGYGTQRVTGAGSPALTFIRGVWGGSFTSWYKDWNAANDGAGSGLDADLLDGQHGSYWGSGGGNVDTNTTYNFAGNTFTSRNSSNPIAIDSVVENMVGYVNSSTAAGFSDGAGFSAAYNSSWVGQLFVDFRTGKLSTRGKNNNTWQAHRFMWDNLNDGAGSGLDADLLDGAHGSSFVRNDAADNGIGARTTQVPTKIYASNDNIIRYYDHSHAKVHLGASGKTTSLPYARSDSEAYRTGSQGWGANNLNDFYNRGSCFVDVWTSNLTGAPAGSHWNGFQSMHYSSSTTYHHGMRLLMNAGNPATTYLQGWWANGGTGYAAQKIWTTGNDGAGSGLDADLLDGQQASAFAPATGGSYLPLAGGTTSGRITLGTQYALVANNYGRGLFGLYSATRYQHVWSMGTSYKTNDSGTSPGNMYGLTFTHTNVGTGTNQSISGLSHQLQGRADGNLWWALGNGIWTTGNITAYSDIAVKTNLVKIPNALEKVCSINGYTYERTDYVKDPEDADAPDILRQAGVVAQEIEKVLPEVVTGKEGNKAVAYGNIVALLIESIKELKDEVDDLRQQLKEK